MERQKDGTPELTSLLYGKIIMEELINSSTAEFIYRTRTCTGYSPCSVSLVRSTVPLILFSFPMSKLSRIQSVFCILVRFAVPWILDISSVQTKQASVHVQSIFRCANYQTSKIK